VRGGEGYGGDAGWMERKLFGTRAVEPGMRGRCADGVWDGRGHGWRGRSQMG